MKIILAIALVTLLDAVVTEIDLRYVDETVNPCDDFYQFACGNFGKYHVRPENQPSLELFSMTEDKLIAIGKEILSTPKHTQDPIALKKAKSAYKACINIEQLDNLPYYQSPEKKIIEEFGGLPLVNDLNLDKTSLNQVAEIAGKTGIPQFFRFMVRNANPEHYIVIMYADDSSGSPPMIRPSTVRTYDQVLEDSLRRLSKSHTRARTSAEDAIDVFLWKIAKHLLQIHNVYKSDEDLKRELDEIKDFMIKLASDEFDDDGKSPPLSVSTMTDLQNWTQEQFGDEIDVDWTYFMQQHFKWSNINITEDFTVYMMDEYEVLKIINLIRKTDPKIVKNFVLFRTFLFMAPDSDLPVRQAFEEYYNSLGEIYYERSDYCARKILDVVDTASLSFALVNEFVNYHFNINKIPKAVKLIRDTQEAFKSFLEGFDWVDKESRELITQKLDNIVVFLGYPEFVLQKTSLDGFYENVRICDWDNYGNAQRIRAFKQAYAFSQYINPDMWPKSAFQVNAYVPRGINRIFAPLAMLQSSFFLGNDPIYDYSRFGSIIAHEFVHHFDRSGIFYDVDGFRIPSWLPNSTIEAVETKVKCFEEQYYQYYVAQADAYINGSRTLDENTADNGGVKHAYRAFEKHMGHQLFKNSTEKYTLAQQFFISYATTWCADQSDAYLTNLVLDNEHSPNRFRVIGPLSNMEEFSSAFNCPVDSSMNPKNKCVLW